MRTKERKSKQQALVERYEREGKPPRGQVIISPPAPGDRLSLIPAHCDKEMGRRPLPCVVEYVNSRGRFFSVRYTETGIRECFPYGA